MKLGGLRFECTGCGKCCVGRGDYYVAATRAEQRRLQRFLKISWRWFRRRYISVREDGSESLRWETDRCIFFDKQARRCRVYAARPGQCRSYPFWPEVLASAPTWRAEGKRCEGIDRGAVIPLEYVEARLQRRRS